MLKYEPTGKKRKARPLGECPNCGGCSQVRPDETRSKYVLVVLCVKGQTAEHRVPPLPGACICCRCGNAPPNGYCSRCMIADRMKRSEMNGKLVAVPAEPEEEWEMFAAQET